MLEALNFPKADLRLNKKNNQIYVWCVIRKKELLCTPEEWVRQHTIHYLINKKNIPESLIASEYSIQYNQKNKRADLVVFNRSQQPILVVECKAPGVHLSKETLFQIAQYNFDLNVAYLYLTNGLNHVVCKLDNDSNKLIFLKELPADLCG